MAGVTDRLPSDAAPLAVVVELLLPPGLPSGSTAVSSFGDTRGLEPDDWAAVSDVLVEVVVDEDGAASECDEAAIALATAPLVDGAKPGGNIGSMSPGILPKISWHVRNWLRSSMFTLNMAESCSWPPPVAIFTI